MVLNFFQWPDLQCESPLNFDQIQSRRYALSDIIRNIMPGKRNRTGIKGELPLNRSGLRGMKLNNMLKTCYFVLIVQPIAFVNVGSGSLSARRLSIAFVK